MQYFSEEKIPTWAICYIEYGDKSNLTDEDEEMIDKWLDELGFAPIIKYDDNPYFTHYPAFGKACDVVDAKIYKP